MKRELNSNLYGNEFNYSACSLRVIFKNLCGKLQRKKSLNFIPFAYQIVRVGGRGALLCLPPLRKRLTQPVDQAPKEPLDPKPPPPQHLYRLMGSWGKATPLAGAPIPTVLPWPKRFWRPVQPESSPTPPGASPRLPLLRKRLAQPVNLMCKHLQCIYLVSIKITTRLL